MWLNIKPSTPRFFMARWRSTFVPVNSQHRPELSWSEMPELLTSMENHVSSACWLLPTSAILLMLFDWMAFRNARSAGVVSPPFSNWLKTSGVIVCCAFAVAQNNITVRNNLTFIISHIWAQI